ncbi:MAG TPA: hypothetical protein VMB34_02500 [Acetobacteraceae bacterium]|nr:hypothetical protein [Acetobacteraceae bacterium]
MASLEDFLTKLEGDALAALTEYNFVVDQQSLDLVQHQPEVQDGFQIDVAMESQGGSTFLMRAATDGDSTRNSLRIWYLPWRKFDGSNGVVGVSQTTLDGKGSGIFLTSQLDACRFTIQDHTGNMTKVTALHLAGNYGSGIKGAKLREQVEQDTLQNVPSGGMRRRYSFGQYSTKPQINKLPTDGVRTYYDGGMATVLGVRDKTGTWTFYGQRYANDAFDKVTVI